MDTALVGHSEERLDKFQQLLNYDPKIAADSTKYADANRSVNNLIGLEVRQAIESGLSVIFCVGETAEERGEGGFNEQKERIRSIDG